MNTDATIVQPTIGKDGQWWASPLLAWVSGRPRGLMRHHDNDEDGGTGGSGDRRGALSGVL